MSVLMCPRVFHDSSEFDTFFLKVWVIYSVAIDQFTLAMAVCDYPMVTFFGVSLCIVADKHRMSLTLSARACVRCMSTSVREKRRRAILDRIIRVDHAGEFGALKIYEGQMAVLGKSPVGPILKARNPSLV